MTRRLRIVVFHLGFFYAGGGEKLVLEEVRELRARGHDVEVLAPIVDPNDCFPDLMREIDPRPLMPRLPRWTVVGDAITLLAASVSAPALVRRYAADVYFGANQPGAWLARAAARSHKKRYVVYLSQPNRLLEPRAIDRDPTSVVVKKDFFLLSGVTLLGRPVLSVLDRWSVRDAAVRLGNGSYMTGILRSYYGGSWRDCPAGTVPALTEPAPSAPERLVVNGQAIDGPFLLLTNRHYPQKRFEWMLPVLDRVRRRHPDFRLVITGSETVYTTKLRERVAAAGLSDCVQFLGLVNEADLTRLYRLATVYVYPSPEEDFGMGMVEAMGQGTPVVAWNNAGPTGIVRDGQTGFLVPLEDISTFATRVSELIGDRALHARFGRAAWREARDRFSFKIHTDTLEAALLEAAS